MKKLTFVSVLVALSIAPLLWGQCETYASKRMPEPNLLREIDLSEDVKLVPFLLSGLQNMLSKTTGKFVRSFEDPVVDEYLQSIVARLIVAAPSSAKKFEYSTVLLETSLPNGAAFGGGKIGLTLGEVANAPSEDALAFAIAHEMGHTALRHMIARLLHIEFYKQQGMSDADRDAFLAKLQSQQEEEADTFAAKVMLAAGYSLKSSLDRSTHEREWRRNLLKCEMKGREIPKENTASLDLRFARDRAKELLEEARTGHKH